MIYDFFVSVWGWDLGSTMSLLFMIFGISFICLIPFFIPVFRNSYYINKMNKRNKKRQKDNFNYQLSKLIGDSKDAEIESLKAEIERLKKEKK